VRKQCGRYCCPKGSLERFDSLQMRDKLMDECGMNDTYIPGHFGQLGETYSDLEGHVCRAVEPQTGSKCVHGRMYIYVCPQRGILEDHRAPSTTDTGKKNRKTCLKASVVWRNTVKIARFVCAKRKYDVTYFWNQKVQRSIAGVIGLNVGGETKIRATQENAPGGV